jgi:hypothetical protein
VLGFRDYILKHDWNPDDWPLENESGVPQVELSNPALGAGTRQRFRLSTLEWTKEKGVFVGWSGQELIALEKHLIAQVNLVTQLQAAISQIQQSGKVTLSAETRQVISELINAFSTLLQ